MVEDGGTIFALGYKTNDSPVINTIKKQSKLIDFQIPRYCKVLFKKTSLSLRTDMISKIVFNMG